MDELCEARDRRQSLYQAAELLNRLNVSGSVEHQFDWQTLIEIPQWCYWPEDKRYALASTAGALFLAPVIKLWIDAARIRRAREVLGESLFDAVMKYQNQPQVVDQPADSVPVDVLLLSTGSSVLYNSISPALQSGLLALLPPIRGQIQPTVAKKLTQDAQQLLLRITREYLVSQSTPATDEEAPENREQDAQTQWNAAFESAQTSNHKEADDVYIN